MGITLKPFMVPAMLACTTLWGEDTQTIKLDQKLEVPGTTLSPGEYSFSVEDRLQDRAIIRITDTRKDSHELLLAVPSSKLSSSQPGSLLYFPTGSSGKQVLQGWMCPTCREALEVVYSKEEAIDITGNSAKSVMAVDPTYDKLPSHLSADDMKVVTLWLLSPKEITPDQKGKGVAAAKYADIKNSPQQTQAVVSAPSQNRDTAQEAGRSQSTTNETQVAATKERRMPHTASHIYDNALVGFVMLLLGGLLSMNRFKQVNLFKSR